MVAGSQYGQTRIQLGRHFSDAATKQAAAPCLADPWGPPSGTAKAEEKPDAC